MYTRGAPAAAVKKPVDAGCSRGCSPRWESAALAPAARAEGLVAQLAELKSKGTRRSEQYEVRPYAPCVLKAVRNICASTILPWKISSQALAGPTSWVSR